MWSTVTCVGVVSPEHGIAQKSQKTKKPPCSISQVFTVSSAQTSDQSCFCSSTDLIKKSGHEPRVNHHGERFQKAEILWKETREWNHSSVRHMRNTRSCSVAESWDRASPLVQQLRDRLWWWCHHCSTDTRQQDNTQKTWIYTPQCIVMLQRWSVSKHIHILSWNLETFHLPD